MAKEKKPYEPPKMKVITLDSAPKLLADSGNACENTWWCDEQPAADDWWGKKS